MSIWVRPEGRRVSPLIVLGVVCSGVFLAALDQTVVVTALPSIMLDVQIPVTELDRAAWIVTGYLLGYTVAMPLIGRVADVYGHARVYLASVFVFMAGSVAVALAPDLSWLVGARVLQAVGGGAVVPIAMAIAADLLPARRRAVALGIIGASAEAGGVLGPLWGGVIVQTLDWRWIFWINIPLGLAIVAMVLLFGPPVRGRNGRVDYRGGLLLTGALACLTLAISGTLPGPYSVPSALLYSGAVGFGLAFLYVEARVGQPLIRLDLFRRLTFASANAGHLLLGGALIIAMVNIPLMADTVMGKEPIEGGLKLMRLTVMIPVGAVAGGFLCQRLGYVIPASLGFLLAALGFYLMAGWPLDVADPAMSLHLLVAGLGFGLVIAPIATAVLNSVEEGYRAAAASLLTVMRMAGMLLGLAALSAWGMDRFVILTADLPAALAPDYAMELTAASLKLFREFFLVSMGLCLVALVPAMLMRRRR